MNFNMNSIFWGFVVARLGAILFYNLIFCF